MASLTALISLTIFATLDAVAQSQCRLGPNLSQMNELYYGSLKSLLIKKKIRLAIFPFKNESPTQHNPETISYGMQLVLNDFLSLSPKIGVFHPFIIWDAMRQQNETARSLSQASMTQMAKELGATHAIFGLVQDRGRNQLRYFVKVLPLLDTKKGLQILEYETEGGYHFFSTAAAVATDILKITKTRISTTLLKNHVKKSPKFVAFRYYVKGMVRSNSYSEIQLSVAKAWLEKAYAHSLNFTSALREKGRVLLMLALIDKEKGKDFTLFVQEARSSLELARQISKRIGQRRTWLPFHLRPERWLKAQEYFVMGMQALKRGKFKGANKQLLQATSLVPEDGLAHFFLAESYRQLGKGAQATSENNLAKDLNPCLE